MLKKLTGVFVIAVSCLFAADPMFLRRWVADVKPQADELTANAKLASYKPIFGIGDADAGKLQSVARYGELTIGPGGATAIVSYDGEEQIYYILEGSGTLLYAHQRVPVKKDDFMYLPVGVGRGMTNSSDAPVRVMVMGYRIPAARPAAPAPKLLLATANDVPLQVLGQHGPTTQFKLLMGATDSRRDKLAAASEMNSLFRMDFAPGGTNIPHRRPREEEIYYVLGGGGELVAGTNAEGKEARRPVKQGEAFFFGPGTLAGFYSGAKAGGEHDLILAARSRLP
jgi:mannose-6-phosphate isomerase-like protein (cupin superfamily)